MSQRTRRVMKELSDITLDTTSGIHITPLSPDDIFHLLGTFSGPLDTPYSGGTFSVDILIPDRYPFQPLKMKFLTRIFHPNVSSVSGAICLDILKDAWSPVFTLKSALISLQSMLCSPEPNDPQDAEVAKLYLTSRSDFEARAREWTKKYALPGSDYGAMAGLDPAHIRKFSALGFEEKAVVDALVRLNYRGDNARDIGDDKVVQELLK